MLCKPVLQSCWLLDGHKFLSFLVGFLQIGCCFSKVCCIFSSTQCQIVFMVCTTPKSQHLLWLFSLVMLIHGLLHLCISLIQVFTHKHYHETPNPWFFYCQTFTKFRPEKCDFKLCKRLFLKNLNPLALTSGWKSLISVQQHSSFTLHLHHTHKNRMVLKPFH